jgi:predicted PurR-regulated permease PerM
MKIKLTREYIISTLVVLLGFAFVYYFTNIFVYMVIAAVIALVGRPLKDLILKIKIKGKNISELLATVLTMAAIIIGFSTIFIILIPAIASQDNELSKLDYKETAHNINQSLASTENVLRKYGILAEGKTLEEELHEYITSFVSGVKITKVANGALSFFGNLFMGIFSVLFMTFFFIKDEKLFHNIVLLFVPESKKESFRNIFTKIRIMLSRYFVGLMTEVGSMMILESIGGMILGLENAILIGFIGGLLNIIPYIGPLIGALTGAVLVFISHINLGMDATMLLVYGILAVFAIANIIDNFLLQPLIYSNSVKAHPLEIFIVIIIGGTLFGMAGMILAIPVYTIIRVIAKEFFYDQAFVQSVTKDL